MRPEYSLFQRWQFPVGTLLSAVVSVAIAACAVGAFVVWAAADLDERTLSRQTALVARIVTDEVARVPREQQSVVLWDDAVIRTRYAFDARWIDSNFGAWLHEYFGHDRGFIVNGADEPVYASVAGVRSNAAVFADNQAAFSAPLLELRDQLRGGSVNAYHRSVGVRDYPHLVDLLTVDGRPAIVAFSPLSSDTGNVPQSPGSEFIHISVDFLDATLAARVSEQFLLDDVRFDIEPTPGLASYTLTDRSGAPLAYLSWNASQPGQTMLARTAPPLAAAFLLGGCVIFFLLDRVQRSAADLRNGRALAEHQATHDYLTDLPNRILFDQKLSRAMPDHRTSAHALAVIMLDLDRFKQVNDTLGHLAGDEVIRAVGQRLRELCGPQDDLARLAGDEFGIIHRSHDGGRSAAALTQAIVEAVAKPFNIFGNEAFLGVSIGFAIAASEDTDHLELVRKADIALYEAKSAGRNRAVRFEDAMSRELEDRLTIETELRDALRRDDQLDLAYQPLFSRTSGRVVGAEVLARWNHPTLGPVAPIRFIPVAEASGLIERLGDFILARACRLGAAWPGMTIAVNISPTQLRNPRFAPRVFEHLGVTGMRPQDLELEITESILLEDEHVASESLAQFRRAGIRIALDDFGTGYSSLNYLKRYPVDAIKIDRSFVSQLVAGNSGLAIVQAMITLAHALNIEVIAEGVETREQMETLARMHCNTFQGFLLSPPVTVALIEGMFRAHAAREDDMAIARVA